MNGDQIKRALIAKFSAKKNMPDWYYQRLEKCAGCEFNSGNVDKISFKDRIRISHNFGKDACLKCTCGIQDKASDPVEQCPLEEPKWTKIEDNVDFGTYLVKNLSLKKATIQKQGTFLLLDYGNIEYATDSKVNLEFDFGEIKNPTVGKSCGCTTPTLKKNDNGTYNVTIEYDTRRFGEIQNKKVWIEYYKGSLRYRVNILLKGNIIKTS